MDPLSISVNITTLLQVTGTIISYLHNMKSTPNDHIKFASELSGMQSLLPVLQRCVEQAKLGDPWFTAVLELGIKNGPLDQVKSHLDQLMLKLKPAEGLKDIRKGPTWVFDKVEIINVLSKVERTKTLVSLVLTDDLL